MNTTSGTPKRNTFNLLIILLLLGCGVALLFKFVPSAKDSSSSSMVGTGEAINPDASSERPVLKPASRSRDEQPPEEQVAARLVAFSKNRREVAHRYAEKLGITVKPTRKTRPLDNVWENRLDLLNKVADWTGRIAIASRHSRAEVVS